ncbi:hypothetical protein CASFOL_001666 [Castilleja foliolosa]|uniref:Uncharacterized protein n=1 Tax=Castilleja foliolosa TaxID=1961234 RepID=A0ABD3EFR9_9LAMI
MNRIYTSRSEKNQEKKKESELIDGSTKPLGDFLKEEPHVNTME